MIFVYSVDTEGSSSIAESRQLEEELRILNNKIDKVEAQAACEELTDIERNIRRLEIRSSTAAAVSGLYRSVSIIGTVIVSVIVICHK